MNGLSFIRRRCNLRQGQLAEKLGVTRQAINLCENRRETLPEARKEQLSHFFGLEPDQNCLMRSIKSIRTPCSIAPVSCTGTKMDTITSCSGKIR